MNPESHDIKFDWWVFSTALGCGWLMLECRLTGATGSVRDPSAEEWAKAYDAPRNPYRWTDDARVVVDAPPTNPDRN